MRNLITIIGLLVTATTIAADPVAPFNTHWVKVIQVHDGDTITEAVIDLGWGRKLHVGPNGEAPAIRAFGYDAWEVTKTRRTVDVSDEEISKGKAATEDLFELLKATSLYVEDSGERDPYGRISAVLWARTIKGDWIYVAEWMEQRGHLRTPRK